MRLVEPVIIFEDESLLVLEKPAGIVVNRVESASGETVQDWLIAYGKWLIDRSDIGETDFDRRAGIVHRLDKETSGLLLVAKTPEAFVELQKQFKERVVKKRYLALVHGKVEPSEGEVRAPVGRLPWSREKFGVLPGGREAMTKYAVISVVARGSVGLCPHPTSSSSVRRTAGARWGSPAPATPRLQIFTLLELFPETGRTHQIRIHLKYLGYPIVADATYAGRKTARQDRVWCSRLFLHASFLGFKHPASKEWMEFKSELPEDLKAVLGKAKMTNS